MTLDKKNFDFDYAALDLPTPCFVFDKAQLRKNLKLLKSIQDRTGCKILLAMKRLFPIADTTEERHFVDMYPSPEEWFNGFSNVTINDRQYKGIPGDTKKRLIAWYGEDYMVKRPEKSSKTTFA